MPKEQQKLSYTTIRNYAERWSWEENGQKKQGINPPAGAKKVERVPYYIKYITAKGQVEEGMVVTLKVSAANKQRMVQYVNSREIRWVRDYLIIEIDGHRFVTH